MKIILIRKELHMIEKGVHIVFLPSLASQFHSHSCTNFLHAHIHTNIIIA